MSSATVENPNSADDWLCRAMTPSVPVNVFFPVHTFDARQRAVLELGHDRPVFDFEVPQATRVGVEHGRGLGIAQVERRHHRLVDREADAALHRVRAQLVIGGARAPDLEVPRRRVLTGLERRAEPPGLEHLDDDGRRIHTIAAGVGHAVEEHLVLGAELQ